MKLLLRSKEGTLVFELVAAQLYSDLSMHPPRVLNLPFTVLSLR